MTESPLLVLADSVNQTNQSKIPQRGVGRECYDKAQKALAENDETAALEALSRAVALCDYAQVVGWHKGFAPDVGPILLRARRVLQENGYRPEDYYGDLKLSPETQQ